MKKPADRRRFSSATGPATDGLVALVARQKLWTVSSVALLALVALGWLLYPVFGGRVQAENVSSTSSAITLTLEDSVALALRQDPDVLDARSAVDGQRAGVRAAEGSLLPSLGVDASYDRTMYDAKSSPAATLTLKADWAGLVPPLYHRDLRLQSLTPLEKAKLSEQAAEYDATRAELSAAFAVTQAFVNLIKARRQQDLSALALQVVQKDLTDTQKQVENGTATPLDLLKAQTQVSSAQFSQVKADHDARAAERALAVLLGLSPGTSIQAVNDLSYDESGASSASSVGQEALADEALRLRPEVRQAELAVRRAEAAYADAARAGDPSLTVDGQYTGGGHYSVSLSSDLISGNTALVASLFNQETVSSGAPLGDTRDGSWNVGVRFGMSVFDGGVSWAGAEQARLTLANQKSNLERQKQAVRDDVYDALTQLKDSVVKVTLAQKTTEQARQTLAVVQTRVEAGAAVQGDLLDARLALAQAEAEELGAVLDYRVSLARLDKAVGRLPGAGTR